MILKSPVDPHAIPQAERMKHWPRHVQRNPVCGTPGCEERDRLVFYVTGLRCKEHQPTARGQR